MEGIFTVLTTFLIALSAVASMLLYMIPGYILIKGKLIRENTISAFATLLIYICSPCLYVYTFQGQVFSKQLLLEILFFAIFTFVIQLGIIGVCAWIFRKKFEDVKYRIISCSAALANCAYFGIPIVEEILPEYTKAPLFAAVFSLVLTIINWTLTCAIILGDKKYISVKKAFLNPASYGMYVGMILLLAGINLPDMLLSAVTTLGRLTTPLSMMIMGMRLATLNFREIFGRGFAYSTALVKLIAMPMIAWAILYFLPIDANLKATAFILCCCPTANCVLSFSEMLGKGQKEAASCVLVSTLVSIVILPLMTLLVL